MIQGIFRNYGGIGVSGKSVDRRKPPKAPIPQSMSSLQSSATFPTCGRVETSSHWLDPPHPHPPPHHHLHLRQLLIILHPYLLHFHGHRHRRFPNSGHHVPPLQHQSSSVHHKQQQHHHHRHDHDTNFQASDKSQSHRSIQSHLISELKPMPLTYPNSHTSHKSLTLYGNECTEALPNMRRQTQATTTSPSIQPKHTRIM